MNLADKFEIRGILELTLSDAVSGNVVFHSKEQNTITYDARSMVNYACAGEIVIDPIKFIAVGSGGYYPNPTDGNVDPPPPSEENTQLFAEIYRKPVLLPINHSTRLSSIFEVELGPNELVNSKISECGLITAGGMLYARRTFKPVTKIESMILNIKWTLLF